MCCFLTVLILLGPRMAILVWWLLEPLRWQVAFPDNWVLGLLGWLFLPWTTLAYALVAPDGIMGFDYILLAFAFIVDIGSYGGGGYGNRDRWRW